MIIQNLFSQKAHPDPNEPEPAMSLASIVAVSNAKKKMGSFKNKRRKGAPKMDTNKALSVMNFSSTREFMDKSLGLDPKKELDKRHFVVMMQILKKKKKEGDVSCLNSFFQKRSFSSF